MQRVHEENRRRSDSRLMRRAAGRPAALLRRGEEEEEILHALYVAAGFGQVIATRASISGQEGGCQAEVGAASAMAAAALTQLRGGTPPCAQTPAPWHCQI